MTSVPPIPEMTRHILAQLVDTARGIQKADRVICNAALVNVYSGEILNPMAIGIKGDWIAYVGNTPDLLIGPETDVIDVGGQAVIPGLIDGHTHLAWMLDISEFLPFAMKSGTTSIVTETMEPYPVAGIDGVEDFLCALGEQPIKIFGTAPAMMSISPAARGIPGAELDRLLSHPRILGLGESYWQAVLQETGRMLPMFERVLAAKKTLEGHSAGARSDKLGAYAACGISSCHEPINAQEALERLQLGFYVMIREGSIRSDLADIAPLMRKGVDTRRLILVTDGVDPLDIQEMGYMDRVVQKAIDCGFSPVDAIQMASLNVAEHFGLDRLIGGIAPCRQADLVVVPDVRKIEPRMVISRGVPVVENGRVLVPPRKHRYTAASRNTVHLNRALDKTDFAISAPGGGHHIGVRVIELVSPLVTLEKHLHVPAAGGSIAANPEADLLKVAAVDRMHHPGKCFTGLIRGFGLRKGAVAASAAWDTSDIVVVGADDADMADAVNRVAEMQGGFALCVDGAVRHDLALPVFGLISESPFPVLVKELKNITDAVISLGFPYDNPLLTLITLTGQAIPFLRICEAGLVNLKDGRVMDLFSD